MYFTDTSDVPPISWADGAGMGPWESADLTPLCRTASGKIATSSVSNTYIKQQLLTISDHHISQQLKYHHNRLTRAQYLELAEHYLRARTVYGRDLRTCFAGPTAEPSGRSCESLMCADHGHAPALNRFRVAGCELALNFPHHYSLVWRNLGAVDEFSVDSWATRVSENFSCLSEANRVAAAVVVVELAPSGYLHAHAVVGASHALQVRDDDVLSIKPLERNVVTPRCLYIAKDWADPVTRPGAVALSRGSDGPATPLTFGEVYGGGYKAARARWPYRSGERLNFGAKSTTLSIHS